MWAKSTQLSESTTLFDNKYLNDAFLTVIVFVKLTRS